MKYRVTVANFAGDHHRREQNAAIAMLPLSMAWSERKSGDVALVAGSRIDFSALDRSGARVLVLADPWRTTAEETSALGASDIPVCPIFSFLPKLWNANHPAVEEPIFSESFVSLQSSDISEALLEQLAVLRSMGARFDEPMGFKRGRRGYTAQIGGTLLSGHLVSGSNQIDAQIVSSTLRLDVKIPGSPSGRPAQIRAASQDSTKESPPRYENSARLTWRLVLNYLQGSATLPYGLQDLSCDIALSRKLLK
jgi:hypothetical protein